MTYQFDSQFAQGNEGESQLDAFFSRHYFILPVSRPMQRLGIDRVFVNIKTMVMHSVEYKTDLKAAQSGNVFLETVSVDKDNKPGWIYSSRADWLFYFMPQIETLYCVEFAQLRLSLSKWVSRYPCKVIPNVGYNTEGIIIPKHEIALLSKCVYVPSGLTKYSFSLE